MGRKRSREAQRRITARYRAKLREKRPDVLRAQLDAKNEAAREKYATDPEYADAERARRRARYAEKKAAETDAGSVRVTAESA